MVSPEDLKIGKIVYIIAKKTQNIFPVIIKEKNICESIDGQKVSFKVLVGDGVKAKLIDLSKIDSGVFSSLEEVKSHLLNNFSAALDIEAGKAKELAHKWYGHLVSPETGESLLESEKYDTDDLLSELANSTVNPQQTHQANNAIQQRNPMMDMQQIESDTVLVEMSDGTFRKVTT